MSRAVHVPTVTKMVRNLRGSDMTSLMPSNEALMFSIYYAAITSMEEEDVSSHQNCTCVSHGEDWAVLTSLLHLDHYQLWLH
jgi:hypothetical protein